MKVELVEFKNRAARSQYIARRFAGVLSGCVLDVGCDMAVLKQLLPGVAYTGVDVGGAPDLELNLEQAGRLPFPDAAFDCVVCTDVLEHLENLHDIFGELVRVSRRHVVLSLPNNWVNARVPLQRGHGSFSHYGLPAEKPRDRHKWFFSLTDAAVFIQAQTSKLPFVCREMFATEKPRPWLVRSLRRLRYPVLDHYLNRYAHTIWTLIERR